MNWLEKMRKSQRAIAENFSGSFVDNCPDSHEFERTLKENLAIEMMGILEKLSWHIAKKAFAHPDFSQKKNAKMAPKEVVLDFDEKQFLQEVGNPDLSAGLRAVETGIIRGMLRVLTGGEYELPNVGKLVHRDGDGDGKVRLVLDRRGLKKMKDLLELEAKQISEAKLRKQDKRAPGLRRLDVSPFDDSKKK